MHDSGEDGNLIVLRLTFDDGYADNLMYALPLLEKHKVPATIFVASGQVDSPA